MIKFDELIKYIEDYIPEIDISEQLISVLKAGRSCVELLSEMEPDSEAAQFLIRHYHELLGE
jgi:hypothetical protein